jgi:hypothetical protein
MKKAFVILVVVLSVSSCIFSQKDFFSTVGEQLKRNNYVIPYSLFSFFPNKTSKYKDLKIVSIFENAKKTEPLFNLLEFSTIEIIETYQCDTKESLQELIKEYRSQSIFSVESESKEYFVLGSGWELSKKYDTIQLKEQYIKLEEIPLVFHFRESFEDMPFLYDTTTISGLPSGYEILVLKSGNEFVLPQDQLYEWSVLPDNLKHGYRSGVAFKKNEPYIIYWVMAW